MRQKYKSAQRGISLTELIIAILLFNVVLLTGLSMELGMRRIFSSADMEALFLGEAGPILTMVTKAINRGVGFSTSPPLIYAASGADENFTIRTDSNLNALIDAGDRNVRFRFRGDLAPSQLWFYRDSTSANYESLSSRVSFFNISLPVNGVSNIVLKMRMNTSRAVSIGNPEITINSGASYRGASQ